MNADKHETDPELAKIRSDRGYTYSDKLELSPTTLPDYETKLKIFFTEHIHSDEEIRFILGGKGYFDVRDVGTDVWIRIEVEKDDLLVLPAGCYHRFTPDMNVGHNFIQSLYLF